MDGAAFEPDSFVALCDCNQLRCATADQESEINCVFAYAGAILQDLFEDFSVFCPDGSHAVLPFTYKEYTVWTGEVKRFFGKIQRLVIANGIDFGFN